MMEEADKVVVPLMSDRNVPKGQAPKHMHTVDNHCTYTHDERYRRSVLQYTIR